ncbi:MAG: glycosyltransferase family 4 protein [Methylacidiphilales bacterium]|nr:glycosyltransferase family 4 protein [Candidatus Methylacidiphilales bacterium]
MPRLIFINRFFHPDHSATSQIVSDLAFALARDGREVVIVTSRLRYEDPADVLPARETINGVRIRRVATTGFGRNGLVGRAVDYVSFYIAALGVLVREVRRGDIVIAKTDPPLISIVAAMVAKAKGARLVNWLQDLYPEVASELGLKTFAGWRGAPLRALRTWSLRAAAANVAIGERMAARLRSLGVAPETIQVIANWCDDAAIEPIDHADNPLRQEWQLADRFVVGYSGNLGRAHEFETILGAARELAGEPDVVFLVIGGGHGVERFRRATADLANVVFKPYQPRDRLTQSLGVSDVHWVSLRPEVEGLIVPSKVYGILAAGRPILAVCDRDGEVARLVERHDCGAHIDIGDSEGLSQVIRHLRDARDESRRLGRNARAALEAHHTKTAMLATWMALLDAAATAPRPAAENVLHRA